MPGLLSKNQNFEVFSKTLFLFISSYRIQILIQQGLFMSNASFSEKKEENPN